jgi:hypothetical protein
MSLAHDLLTADLKGEPMPTLTFVVERGRLSAEHAAILERQLEGVHGVRVVIDRRVMRERRQKHMMRERGQRKEQRRLHLNPFCFSVRVGTT